MSRNNISGSRTSVMDIPNFLGKNDALPFSKTDNRQAREMLNFLPNAIGSMHKRPGSIPVSNQIGEVNSLHHYDYLIAAVTKNQELYIRTLSSNDFSLATAVNPLQTNRVDACQFKNDNGDDVLVIADGGVLKEYNAVTGQLKNITPSVNDEAPLPANDLANINTNHPPVGCLVHNTRVVIWTLNSDTIWHSKIGYHDYFPQVDYQRFVREGDVIKTCVTYRGALLVFMQNHIGVLFGHDRDDWQQDFLDTTDGCINAKTVQTVMFPDGRQEVFYLSHNGVHSVKWIDTYSTDSSAQYSTRSVTENKIKWEDLGVSYSDWSYNAVAHYYDGQYWLIYQKNGVYKGLVFDTRLEEWFPIDNLEANAFIHNENGLFYAGPQGRLRQLKSDLYSDWNDEGKVTGKPINAYWYSKMLTPKLTGFDHMWDILMIEARQFPVQSSLDVEVNTYQNQYLKPSALKTAVFIWGVTEWGESQWANPKLTDLLNNAKRLRTFTKGQYAQIKLSNNRDEPVEIYGIRYEVRVMDKYY